MSEAKTNGLSLNKNSTTPTSPLDKVRKNAHQKFEINNEKLVLQSYVCLRVNIILGLRLALHREISFGPRQTYQWELSTSRS